MMTSVSTAVMAKADASIMAIHSFGRPGFRFVVQRQPVKILPWFTAERCTNARAQCVDMPACLHRTAARRRSSGKGAATFLSLTDHTREAPNLLPVHLAQPRRVAASQAAPQRFIEQRQECRRFFAAAS